MAKYNEKYWDQQRYQKMSCICAVSGGSYTLQLIDKKELKVIFICRKCGQPKIRLSLEDFKQKSESE